MKMTFQNIQQTIPSHWTKKISSYDKSSAIRIEGKLCNDKNLEIMPNLKNLYVFNIKSKELLDLSKLRLNLETLYLYNAQIDDLSILEEFKSIQYILLNWNSETHCLWNLKKNLNLVGLYVNDFKNLKDLSGLGEASGLKYLSLSGGIQNTLKVDTLKPLANLRELEYLSLTNIVVNDGGLYPLKDLKKLKELVLSNQFETGDYAMLSVYLKNTKCNLFLPYVKISKAVGGKDVMITGRRKPLLNSRLDKEIIQKYVTEFNKFKQEIDINL